MTTGLLGQLTEKLSGQDHNIWEAELRKFLGQRPCWTREAKERSAFERPPENSEAGLLQLVSPIVIPARDSPFLPSKEFIIRGGLEARPKICNIGPFFRANFLDGPDVIEERPAGPVTLNRYRLTDNATDSRIFTALGGRAGIETKMFALHYLLRQQGSGEPNGPLLVEKGWWNIFYLLGFGPRQLAAFCFWDPDGSTSRTVDRDRGGHHDGKGGGWDLRACPLDYIDQVVPWWCRGYQVFSPSPVHARTPI